MLVSGRLMAKFLLFKEGEEEKGRSFAVSSILNKTNFMEIEQNKTIDKEQTNKRKRGHLFTGGESVNTEGNNEKP